MFAAAWGDSRSRSFGGETIFGIRCRTLAGMAVTALTWEDAADRGAAGGADPADRGARSPAWAIARPLRLTRGFASGPVPWREQTTASPPAPKSDQ